MTRNDRDAQIHKRRPLLRNVVAHYRLTIALLALTSFVGALLEALFLVIITGIAMSLIGGEGRIGPFLGQTISTESAMLMSVGLLVARLVLSLWAVGISTRLTATVTSDQRKRLAHAYLKSSWAIQSTEPAGRLQELLTSFVTQVSSAVATLTQAITAFLSLFAFLATGLSIDPFGTLAVLVALVAVGAVLVPLRRHLRTRSRASAKANLGFATAVAELGSLGMEMQTFGVRERFTARIDELTQIATESQRRVGLLRSVLPPVYVALAYGAVLAGVAALTLTGTEQMATIGAIMLLMLRSLSYGQALASHAGSLTANAPFLERVEETTRKYAEAPAEGGPEVPRSPTPIEVTDVTFTYEDGRPGLVGANLDIASGEMVGVIGPSGAGKSTLAQLLLGLRAPTFGVVTVSNCDLRDVHREWWTQRVAFVSQEASLITGTVAENLRFFRDSITDQDLQRAASQANVLSDIEALPDGFDTSLGERGRELSGGQRQRMSIARALAGSPEVLVLDEPTSALDGQSEALIRRTLGSLHGQVTIIIIAHRMSTLDFCDRIAVIEDGCVTAFDTPQALAQTSDFYQRALSSGGKTLH